MVETEEAVKDFRVLRPAVREFLEIENCSTECTDDCAQDVACNTLNCPYNCADIVCNGLA